ncbi:hypothetical protein BMF94_1609 [Rhodotorula taiwanensis]|uniref:Phosphatidylglycerol/phosphatidylinositol transfer protein n=1 Tax=Rhodotorula taiwanensis TaxID=741276 RepID=A0A2S5BEP7_9BASI|nr:hypothetical protein BMF94_1609 [Rhodotorula taiwanensis]
MLLKATAAIALLSSAVFAAPAQYDQGAARPQVVLSGARQAALNWGADKLSKLGDNGEMHAMTQWGWTDCGLANDDPLKIESLQVTPDPPKPGRNLTINATGKVSKRIEVSDPHRLLTSEYPMQKGTSADVTVKLGLIKLLTKRFDLCEELVNIKSSLQCPIEPGTHDFTASVDLPAEIPRAKFVVSAKIITPDDTEETGCLDLWINFLVPDQH